MPLNGVRQPQLDIDDFPVAGRVYLADDAIRLNLITCGGAFDERTCHYVDNTVAFAKLSMSASLTSAVWRITLSLATSMSPKSGAPPRPAACRSS